jgi:hypothetical protein
MWFFEGRKEGPAAAAPAIQPSVTQPAEGRSAGVSESGGGAGINDAIERDFADVKVFANGERFR